MEKNKKAIRAKDEIYRIFYLADRINNEYFNSQKKIPTTKELANLAQEITTVLNGLAEGEGKNSISGKTIKRILGYLYNNPRNIGDSSLNTLIRFLNKSHTAEFKSKAYKQSVEKEVTTYKRENSKFILDFFKMFEDLKIGVTEFYDFDEEKVMKILNSKTTETKSKKSKEEDYKDSIKSLKEELELLKTYGIKQTLSLHQFEQIKNYFNIWSEDKIAGIYRDFLETELKKTHKKLHRAIWLNRYFGGLGVLIMAKDELMDIYEGFKKYLHQKFEIEFENELMEMNTNSESDDDSNENAADTDTL